MPRWWDIKIVKVIGWMRRDGPSENALTKTVFGEWLCSSSAAAMNAKCLNQISSKDSSMGSTLCKSTSICLRALMRMTRVATNQPGPLGLLIVPVIYPAVQGIGWLYLVRKEERAATMLIHCENCQASTLFPSPLRAFFLLGQQKALLGVDDTSDWPFSKSNRPHLNKASNWHWNQEKLMPIAMSIFISSDTEDSDASQQLCIPNPNKHSAHSSKPPTWFLVALGFLITGSTLPHSRLNFQVSFSNFYFTENIIETILFSRTKELEL